MSDNFTLKIGSVDLSPYIRIGDGNQGFDPYDGDGFVDPQFGVSPFADGQPLISSDVQNRQMSWPLNLSSYSKDDVHRVVRSITNEIATNPQLRVEWRDAGATDSTFYDVAFARFDPEFNYRRSEQNWAMGTLRIWCAPPFGHTGTTRVVATAAASGAGVYAALPTVINGDAPALLEALVRVGTPVHNHGRIIGVAALPHPSYQVDTPAASMVMRTSVGTNMGGASGAQGSQVIAFPFSAGASQAKSFSMPLFIPSVYAGKRHRVMGIVDPFDRTGGVLKAYAPDGTPLSATVLATSWGDFQAQWALVDFGVWSAPSQLPASAALQFDWMGLGFGSPSGWRRAMGYYSPSWSLGPWPRINRMWMLPEDAFCLTRDVVRQPLAQDSFLSGATGSVHGRYDMMGNQWLTATKYLTASGSGAIVSGGGIQAFVGSQFGWHLNNLPMRDGTIEAVVGLGPVPVAPGPLRERIGVAKFCASDTSQGAISLQAYVQSASQAVGPMTSFAIRAPDGSTVASISIPTIGFPGIDDAVFIRLHVNGPVATAVLVKHAAASSTAFGSAFVISASNASIDSTGEPGIFGISSAGSMMVYDFQAISIPSAAMGPRDVYHFDGPNADQVYRSTASDAYKGDITGNKVGAIPRLIPSQTAGVFAFAILADGGAANELIDVTVKVRERFTFAR